MRRENSCTLFFPAEISARVRRTSRRRTSLCSRVVAAWMIFVLTLLFWSESTSERVHETWNATPVGRFALSSDENEPDLVPLLRTVLQAMARNSTKLENSVCSRLVAPEGETLQLTPMCAVGGTTGRLVKPRCVSQELFSGSTGTDEGATRAACVKRGYQRKCYVKNIVFRGGTFYTLTGKELGMPHTLFAADDLSETLARYHHYYGNRVRRVSPEAMGGSWPLSYCRYVVTAPVVFMHRTSGHSTYHLWVNNLGPLFDTLRDNFGYEGIGGGKGVFGGETPVIIAVDKPHHGSGDYLLDTLLQYFTDFPILRAAEFTESTCFTRAIIGISSSSFDQATMRQQLLQYVALQERLKQLLLLGVGMGEYASAIPRDCTTILRRLMSGNGGSVAAVVDRWFAWSLRRWQKLPRIPNVLYLSRNHPNRTRGRKVVNEADVFPAFESAVRALTGGTVQRLFLEEMPYIDQIMKMSRTNILIAAHGGGIANCVWMPPGSVVMEFVAPAGATLLRMYKRLCNRVAGSGVQSIKHIPFLAEQDPAEREPGFEAAKSEWRTNKRLFSNMLMPPERLIEYFTKALELYRAAWLAAGSRE